MSFEYLQPYVLPTFLGVVAGALAIWNVRLTSDKSDLEDELDALNQELDSARGLVEEWYTSYVESVKSNLELALTNEDLLAQNQRFLDDIVTLSKKIPKRDEHGRFKPKAGTK
jgi:hypothetical protein